MTWTPALSAARMTSACRWVRCGHGHDIQVGELAQDVQPWLGAGERLGRVAGPAFEILLRAPGGLLRARGHGDELELHGRQFARPLVQAHAPELRADAGALQVRVSPGVNVAAEHAGAHQRNLDRGPIVKQDRRLASVLLARAECVM